MENNSLEKDVDTSVENFDGENEDNNMAEKTEQNSLNDGLEIEFQDPEASLELGLGRKKNNCKTEKEEIKVTYFFRDIMEKMVDAWTKLFKGHEERVKISSGDIFKDAPAVDALVSPANSFGFMDGGIDMVYTNLFGWQMQKRLQKVIREEYDGENIVGNAIIIPAYDEEPDETVIGALKKHNYNEGQPIKYLISAPTMRVPKDVVETTNAYLAFRAVILSVQKHNRNPQNQPIRSVLCPGLGTAVGRMPVDRCAYQMLQAYEIHDLKIKDKLLNPAHLWIMTNHDADMEMYKEDDKRRQNTLQVCQIQ